MPLPRSLANLKREVSEKKRAKACQGAGGQTSKTKYRMPKSQRPDGTAASSTKRLASRLPEPSPRRPIKTQTKNLLVPRNPEPEIFSLHHAVPNLPCAVPSGTSQNVPDSSHSALVVSAAACRCRG